MNFDKSRKISLNKRIKNEILTINKITLKFLGEALKLNVNGWTIDARGIYVVIVMASLGFFTFTVERCAQILRLIITCLNTPVENQRREKFVLISTKKKFDRTKHYFPSLLF